MSTMKWFTCLLSLVFLMVTSCKRDNIQPGQNVEIFLLRSFQNVPGKCQIDSINAALSNTAIVTNNEILAYNPATYEMKIRATAFEKVQMLFDFTPFALTIDKKVIYYGYFKPSFSSASCEHSITMDINTASESLQFKLGYPGRTQASEINDERNNELLLVTLLEQGKLRY